MVGVATAKKCNTCRTKKIKCDQQKPWCGQCRKGARVCEWSRGPATFFNRSSTDYETPRRNGKVRFRNQFVDDFEWIGQDDRQLTSASGPACHASRVCKNRKMIPQTSIEVQSPKLTPRFSPPSPLHLQSWLHDEILAEFLDHCLPLGATQEVPLSWLRSLMPMEKEIDALPLAMSALAIGWAGHANGEPQLIDKGLQLYNAGVRQLIGDIQGRAPLQVLATTVIFTIYELFEFGSETSHGWLCHVSGIAASLRILGPAILANEPYLQIFSFVRMMFMIQGMRRRQTACAAAPMWRTIPYAHFAKNQFHKLLDLALLSTQLLEEADSVQDFVNPSTSDDARGTLCRILEHIHNLKKWEEEAQISLINGPTDMLGGSIITSLKPPDRTTLRGYPSKIPNDAPVTFDGLQNARLMHLYWGVLLTLYMTILDNATLRSELEALQKSLSLDDSKPGDSTQLMTISQVRKQAGQMADNIALYSEFCCQNLWQSFGPMISIFTLETAVRWHSSNETDETGSPRPGNYLKHCQSLLDSIKMQSEERPMFEAYQNVTFRNINILRLPWCDPPSTAACTY